MSKKNLEYYLKKIVDMGGIIKVKKDEVLADSNIRQVDLEMYSDEVFQSGKPVLICSSSICGKNLLDLVKAMHKTAKETKSEVDGVLEKSKELIGSITNVKYFDRALTEEEFREEYKKTFGIRKCFC